MADTPATRTDHRAQLLGMATAAQRSLDLDDLADFYYRQGTRDAYAYAAALLVTGRPGDVTRTAADRVTQLLGEGITDLGVLMEANEITPRPPTGLDWVGQGSFDRLTKNHPGIDHDLGQQWGTGRGIRISHRLTEDATVGLLYAYDRTWDEYAILDPAAHVDTVARTFHAALDTDPHLPVPEFITLLRQHTPSVATQPDPPGVQL
jgi:hypothetical protein